MELCTSFGGHASYSGEVTTIIRAIASASLILTSGIALNQSPPAVAATFEVAAINPTHPDNRDLGLHQTNGLFVATGFTLQRLIAFSYDVELF